MNVSMIIYCHTDGVLLKLGVCTMRSVDHTTTFIVRYASVCVCSRCVWVVVGWMRMLCGASCLCMTLCILNDMIDVTLTAENLFHPDQVHHFFFLFCFFMPNPISCSSYFPSVEPDGICSWCHFERWIRKGFSWQHPEYQQWQPNIKYTSACESRESIILCAKALTMYCGLKTAVVHRMQSNVRPKRWERDEWRTRFKTEKYAWSTDTYIHCKHGKAAAAAKKTKQSKRENGAARTQCRYGEINAERPSTFCTF